MGYHGQARGIPRNIPACANLPAEQVLWQAGASAGHPPLSKIRRSMTPAALHCYRCELGIPPRPRSCLHTGVPAFAETLCAGTVFRHAGVVPCVGG